MLRISDIRRILFTGTAVYISDDFIDTAGAVLTKKGIQFSYITRFPLATSIKGVPFSEAKDTIEKIIAKTFENEKTSLSRVAVNIRDDDFMLRRFVLKEIPNNELDKAVIYEAQRYIPYGIENLVFRYRKGAKEQGSQEVIFAASERENIENLANLFEANKLSPSVIEPAPMLLARIAGLEQHTKKEEVYLTVHYEPTNKIAITGIWQKQPYFFRDIAVYPEVQPMGDMELRYPSLNEVWADIEREILSSIEYMRKETKKEISKIFVSGFSYTREEEEISSRIGVRIERFKFLSLQCSGVESPDKFAPIIALVYDLFHPPFLNLAREKNIYTDPWAYRPVLFRTGVAVLVILIAHLLFISVNAWEEKKINSFKKGYGIYEIMKAETTTSEILKYDKAMRDKLGFIDNVLSNRLELAEKLSRLSNLMPSNAWVNTLDFNNSVSRRKDNQLKLRCEFYSSPQEATADINDIINRLETDKTMMKGFGSVKLVYARERGSLGDKKITEFEILLK